MLSNKNDKKWASFRFWTKDLPGTENQARYERNKVMQFIKQLGQPTLWLTLSIADE